jgi:NAD(P)-dependent dehydrogenase (short-subunit alcohol dehydrogenase family)
MQRTLVVTGSTPGTGLGLARAFANAASQEFHELRFDDVLEEVKA